MIFFSAIGAVSDEMPTSLKIIGGATLSQYLQAVPHEGLHGAGAKITGVEVDGLVISRYLGGDFWILFPVLNQWIQIPFLARAGMQI